MKDSTKALAIGLIFPISMIPVLLSGILTVAYPTGPFYPVYFLPVFICCLIVTPIAVSVFFLSGTRGPKTTVPNAVLVASTVAASSAWFIALYFGAVGLSGPVSTAVFILPLAVVLISGHLLSRRNSMAEGIPVD